MPNRRLCSIVLALTAACAAPASGPSIDAGPLPIEPTGRFAVRSSISLAAPPGVATGVLAELAAAVDGPDDPSRYLIELILDRLPPGPLKTLALELAPFVAAYVNDRIATVAPAFESGARALVQGLGLVARHIVTTEDVELYADGRMRRTIQGLRFDAVPVAFAELGLGDVTADTRVVLEGADRIVIARHVADVAYGPLLRVGFDRAVIPSVVPGAGDLAGALVELVDCAKLGALIADALAFGSPGAYAGACTIGLTAAAARIYDEFPAHDTMMPLALEVAGVARAVDGDGDGAMDAIEDGTWTGTFDHAGLAGATFEGPAR